MKVALVFDIPDDIEIEKTKVSYITIAEKKANKYMVQTMKIDCQLRPLPHIEIENGTVEWNYYIQGWNACIDELTGETE